MGEYEQFVEKFAEERGITKEQAENHSALEVLREFCEEMERGKHE